MKGSELIFMAPRSRRHSGIPVLDAVAKLAREHGIKHLTRRVDSEGIGNNGHIHSTHFFDLADEPEELMYVLDNIEADTLMRAVEKECIHVFCVRRPIEYWKFGEY